MANVLTLYKPIGYTPYQLITHLKSTNPSYQLSKIGYAGRLDPMAEGVVLVLVGDENKKRKVYEQLPKQYRFSILFGVATDSYDLLGIPNDVRQTVAYLSIDKTRLNKILPACIGTFQQAYPPFSAKPVLGKPLYYWARQKKLSSLQLPEKTVTIHSLHYLFETRLAAEKLHQEIVQKIQIVQGDFRQNTILSSWAQFFTTKKETTFPVLTFEATVSSGTYIRSLAVTIGEMLNIPALAYHIFRTKVGKYSYEKALRLPLLSVKT